MKRLSLGGYAQSAGIAIRYNLFTGAKPGEVQYDGLFHLSYCMFTFTSPGATFLVGKG